MPVFKIPKGYSHVIDDESAAVLRCEDIWGHFSKNPHLKKLLLLKSEFEDLSQIPKKEGPEEYFKVINQKWEQILAYYALMDNQESPFQSLKDDESYKSKVVKAVLGISENTKLCAIIDFTDDDTTDLEKAFYNALTENIRIPYTTIACRSEWQAIIETQRVIYRSRIIAQTHDAGVKPDNVAKIAAEKLALIADCHELDKKVKEMVENLYGRGSHMATAAHKLVEIFTAFEQFSLKRKSNINAGQ